ncbi:DNA repair protein RecN [Amorphus orientalis]|uniref:DNA repair protein RecN n=1 Tax=Amorphus orientalis TaxID=649198 RepID=A0AAE4ARN9_9HYPH|nr:DNA repair protein RecN [Amorphus orientalis]MDQ0315326.1 DNA repair protein RecN (Recombination protein N) [Amorphus orientalis]
MLTRLSIRDIVLIDRLDIDFTDGLTVLTGETGAGKSILLDSLSLALGARGDAELVRNGCERGQVTAVFDVGPAHPLLAHLAEDGIETEGDLILRRVQSADGRSKAFVNDQPVSVGRLREVGAALVEIHGQHADRALVDPAVHRELVDAFGGLSDDVKAVRAAWQTRRRAERELSEQEARIEAARREADYLRAAVEELVALDPMPGEETELAEKRQQMMQVEKVAGDLSEAFSELDGQGSPIPTLSSLMRRLARKAEAAPDLLQAPADAIGRALDSLEEARTALEDALARTEFDPRVLEQTEERLFALRAAARKYQVQVDDLAALRDRMSADLADLDAGEEKLAALGRAVEEAKQAYSAAAERLTEGRVEAARTLEETVGRELPALKLERAAFIAEIKTDPDGGSADGNDQIEFWVRTNPGTRPGPMMKVASGGELSRFLLALKVSLAGRGSAPTLVFDEIDSGVGGAVSEAIGHRLAKLADSVQVLTVTHAPQVAARAAGHMLIAKESLEMNAVATRVKVIDGDHRLEEIARMLSGATITDEARAAASKLMTAAE